MLKKGPNITKDLHVDYLVHVVLLIVRKPLVPVVTPTYGDSTFV